MLHSGSRYTEYEALVPKPATFCSEYWVPVVKPYTEKSLAAKDSGLDVLHLYLGAMFL